jgi:hypothetical protein
MQASGPSAPPASIESSQHAPRPTCTPLHPPCQWALSWLRPRCTTCPGHVRQCSADSSAQQSACSTSHPPPAGPNMPTSMRAMRSVQVSMNADPLVQGAPPVAVSNSGDSHALGSRMDEADNVNSLGLRVYLWAVGPSRRCTGASGMAGRGHRAANPHASVRLGPAERWCLLVPQAGHNAPSITACQVCIPSRLHAPPITQQQAAPPPEACPGPVAAGLAAPARPGHSLAGVCHLNQNIC